MEWIGIGMIMQSDAIQVRVDRPVGSIILNRPQRANALTRSMIESIREALRDLYLQKSVRAIVLTGAGEVFCAGRDIQERASVDSEEQANLTRWGEEVEELRSLLLDMLEFPKPIIAAVNGPALGSGAGLALAADVTLGCPGARFGLPDARLGMTPGLVAPLLAYRIGAGPAGRLLLTSEPVDAAEALRIGVYHEMVSSDFLWARGVEIGRQCAAGSAEALSLTKRLLLDTTGEPLASHLTSGVIATATSRTTESAQEGLEAFLEKRKPSWWP